MKFTFKAYNDLGRCSYATLMESFDTEKDVIYVGTQKVEVTKIEDLFPFIWESPGIAWRNGDESSATFSGPGTHWHRDFDESIKREAKKQANLKKKIEKSVDEKKIAKWTRDLAESERHQQSLQRIIDWCDKAMEEQKEKLIQENAATND